jgi:hypothetical protein
MSVAPSGLRCKRRSFVWGEDIIPDTSKQSLSGVPVDIWHWIIISKILSQACLLASCGSV